MALAQFGGMDRIDITARLFESCGGHGVTCGFSHFVLFFGRSAAYPYFMPPILTLTFDTCQLRDWRGSVNVSEPIRL